MEVKIYTPYGEKPPRVPEHPGNRYETEYKERYDEYGHAYLEEVGKVDVYEKIQSHKEECDISCILAKYAAGDQTVMNRPGYYIDTTVLPQNITEYMNLMNEQREKFNALPLDIKQKFGNSFEEWAASAGNKQWLEKMGMLKKEEPKDEQKQ